MPSFSVRINRYLASAGLGSRRACERLVTDGAVRINGTVVKDLATLVGPDDRVIVSGRLLVPEPRLVIALNKPPGYICSREDLENRKTIFDLLPAHGPRLFYVGRLDMESEGLLIVTNDGELCQELTHPRHKIAKTYEVGVVPKFDPVHIPKLLKGLPIEPGFARMDSVHVVNDFLIRVVLSQGLKRQIRLMMSKLGYRVRHLKRVRIGGFSLGTLKPGEFKRLSERDIKRVLRPATEPSRPRSVKS